MPGSPSLLNGQVFLLGAWQVQRGGLGLSSWLSSLPWQLATQFWLSPDSLSPYILEQDILNSLFSQPAILNCGKGSQTGKRLNISRKFFFKIQTCHLCVVPLGLRWVGTPISRAEPEVQGVGSKSSCEEPESTSRCGSEKTNPTRKHEVAGSIPGLAQWLRIQRCHELWCRSQMRLNSHVVVAVAWAGICSSDSTPTLGTSTCHGYGSKKKKRELLFMYI